MKTLAVVLALVCVGCSKGTDASDTSFASVCETPTTVSHTFVNWPSEASDSYNCPSLYSKMDCHYYVGQVTGVKEMTCSDINGLDPQGVPDGYFYHSSGTRDFFDGQELSSTAYDGGMKHGLRCFYFVHPGAPADENIVCQ